LRLGSRVRQLLLGIALPVVAIVAAAALVTLAYVAFDGHGPDWMSYYEYTLLYSGGYGALPVEVTGAVWYLVVLFILVSAVVVRFLVRDPSNPRLFVAAHLGHRAVARPVEMRPELVARVLLGGEQQHHEIGGVQNLPLADEDRLGGNRFGGGAGKNGHLFAYELLDLVILNTHKVSLLVGF
jgi:hypothetical protein